MESAGVPPTDLGQPLPPPVIDGDVEDGPPAPESGKSAPTLEKWTRTAHPRGRQARDPLAVSVRYQCSSMESMQAQLRAYIAQPTAPAEHATLEFAFPTSAAFMVAADDKNVGEGSKNSSKAAPFPTLSRSAISVVDALSQLEPKEQLRKQKAIAKAIVESVAAVDGYRYSFHNNWVSKEDEACRFSYYCNDSTLNKGRAANEGAGMAGKKKVKPVYDCCGIVHIKFSVTKQSLEVHYRHIPLHQTYEERAPPPRRDSKRRKFLEIFAPDKLPKPGERKRKSKDSKDAKEPRLKKKRHTTEPLLGVADGIATTNGDDSLAPLMDFLGSAEKEGEQPGEASGEPHPGSAFEPPTFSSEKFEALKGAKARPRASRGAPSNLRQGRARASNIPGTMAGYLVGDDLEIQWTHEKDKSVHATTSQQNGTMEPLHGIVAAAAEAADESPTEPQSELDMLKQKLLEAEQRIQRLESEKQRPMGPPGWPPPAPPAAPQGYGYPYPGYSYHQSGPAPGPYAAPQPQYQYPPPQQHQQTSRTASQGQKATPHHVDRSHRPDGQARQSQSQSTSDRA